MDETTSYKKSVVCTQDQDNDCSSTSTPAPSFNVSVTETVKRFGHYPTTIASKFVCAAIQLEQNGSPISNLSPHRKTLMGELQYIDELSSRLHRPALKTELSELAAGQYLANKNTGACESSKPRALVFVENQTKHKEQEQDPIIVRDNPLKIAIQTTTPLKKSKKKYTVRKTKDIDWKKLASTIIESSPNNEIAEEFLSTYLQKNYPHF